MEKNKSYIEFLDLSCFFREDGDFKKIEDNPSFTNKFIKVFFEKLCGNIKLKTLKLSNHILIDNNSIDDIFNFIKNSFIEEIDLFGTNISEDNIFLINNLLKDEIEKRVNQMEISSLVGSSSKREKT